MTTIADATRSSTADDVVVTGVVAALAAQGIAASTVNVLFGGRQWCMTVHLAAPGMTDTEARIAVWNTVANYTAIHGVLGPVDGIRVHVQE